MNIWYRIWSIRQLKFFIPSWSQYFQFIVLYELFIFSMYSTCLDLIKQHIYCFSLSFFYIGSIRFRYFTIFRIHKYSTHFVLYFTEFVILLYTFLVISFVRYKDYMIRRISFSKFSDVLPAFTCASVICNL